MGPLHGVRVIEIASLAPAPFGCMVLADLGADVLRVDRAGGDGLDLAPAGPLSRSRRSIALNLKDPAGIDVLLRLADTADVLVEAFRPGVAERLGFGPDVCAGRNPRLIYARMTGWGQHGPLAGTAGHDIDYIAVAGSLDPIGRAGQRPVPPLNLVGDFGGGGMLLAVGVLAALLERERSGLGQVVDAAMVDGSALLASFLYGLRAAGAWQDERGTNLLDGGAPFYDTYRTADGRHMAVGALEPKFYAELLARLGLDPAGLPAQYDRSGWPELRARLTEVFAGRTQADWAAVFDGSDACVAPVVSPADAPDHPHNAARGTFVDVGGLIQPAPAPRFSRTPSGPPVPPVPPGASTGEVLAGLGFTAGEITSLRDQGAVAGG
ncbi:MAG TPA: CaiB/BaiF CoA-transferase family protein [Streptosporangiaceae bacterium]|jgi:alpha-methylacyl-CoA racemase|nr:CaiB/BaiF CoA-transferase family protein [Streptosporangiaceae bacterium]